MPRLDAERVALWRSFARRAVQVGRAIDAELFEDHGVTLAQFDVLSALRDAGGSMRVGLLCTDLGEVPSSLSRRLDRMEAEGWLSRRATPTADDGRAVSVTLSRDGRLTWRDANVTYRRVVQSHFAHRLTETDIAALQRVLGKVGG